MADYNSIAEKIIALKDADLALRDKLIATVQLGNGYNDEMASLHNSNAKALADIMNTIGYPTIDKVGKQASEAAWLVIQHAIGQPQFMRKSATLLASAVKENKADLINLAYLTDRIATLEEKPQLYGTQFDWNEKRELSPAPFDSLIKVNERRKALGLNTLEEQTEYMRNQVKNENQSPPQDFEQRKREMEDWKVKVGWIKYSK